MKLDQKDLQILKHLQQDSKMTNKEIANKLELSVTAVFERIKRLEREGIISKYVAIISPDKVEKNFMVFCQIKLIQHSRSYLTKLETEVTKLTEVLECYHVSGEYDYILKVLVKDMEAYREFMVTKLTNLDHIGSTQSTFIISPVKSTTAVPL
ncbi:Lrp/AsnC family transcriptional regulator, leucine-responsive regulatory protein [Salegentibacter holothuriorum]|uniref:Lrp/AsnC family transcriptional regulator, leucine-responsive regulatory protein n=1 Tax=Salegentibacter holothuriorum TaxID=241145 RepID=A0A1T5EQT1_9FLAO|nr:Lrp/AsnC family transcriptional regulator [Salegentibacter holothuriorum]SKB86301.1 Lrp/AsnC family transcriptional regulator, leucine-responsive regulatory protein [Salegentibacter holothuriorum]